MAAQEFDISAMDPYNINKSVRVYLGSCDDASILSCSCKTPVTLPKTATLSRQLESKVRHISGGGTPPVSAAASKRSSALISPLIYELAGSSTLMSTEDVRSSIAEAV